MVVRGRDDMIEVLGKADAANLGSPWIDGEMRTRAEEA